MKKLLILGLAGAAGLFVVLSQQKNSKNSNNQDSKQAIYQENESFPESKNIKSEEINESYTWNELGIKPISSIEGDNYTFTAFDYDQKNKELVIAGSYEKNKLTFVKGKNTKEV